MTAALPHALTIAYPAPTGLDVPIKLARLDTGEHVFTFLDIALALGYETAGKMNPDCDAAHCATIQFANLPRARKCVTLDGLFTCTRLSRTDTGQQPATGPAAHFHDWLRTVILPLLASPDWPPPTVPQVALQRAWRVAQREKLDEEIEQLDEWLAMQRGYGDAEPTDPGAQPAFSLDALDAVLKV